MSPTTFGERLAWLRDVTGVGSRELGRLAGFSESYASVIEGSAVSPSFKTLAKVAGVFGVDAMWLGAGSGDSPNEDGVRLAVKAARERLAPDPTTQSPAPEASTGTDGE